MAKRVNQKGRPKGKKDQRRKTVGFIGKGSPAPVLEKFRVVNRVCQPGGPHKRKSLRGAGRTLQSAPV